ncbi:MAG: amidohydrolase family protein [Candidatus Niyogibacteria bacterium]|nr:amidohydrolase family protein [Candidatus Niyogibacteria bacterium]
MAHYDILIKNGMVIDGKRGRIRREDVGINNDKIKFIGDLAGESSAELEIDANGKYVAPGFIDLTNHSDAHWRIFSSSGQESMLYQGVTTILGGNCGISLAPLISGKDIEGLEKWVNVSEININWQTMDEFLEEMEKQKLGVNFATLVGHGTLRHGIVKDNSPVSAAEINQMRLLLDRSIKAGAFGFSTSLGAIYEKSASPEEVIELLKVAAEHNAFSKHHLRNEGMNILPSVSEIISFARESGANCQISHLKAVGRRGGEHVQDVLNLISQAREEGLKITADVFPYTSTGSDLFMLLPAWVLEEGKDAILEQIRDQEKRKSLILSLKELTLHFERIIIASVARGALAVAGKTLLEIAEDAGKAPEEVMLDLLDINELRVSIFNEIIKKEDIEKFIIQEYAMVASDGAGYALADASKKDLPHPRSFGAFPKVFADFVKEKKLFGWEDAVYKMSGFPALVLGLKDRGILEKGAMADVTIFNPENIQDQATYKNPFQLAKGMEWVIVNGRPIIENGVFTGALNGKILKKF